jgi:hypothetical protein
MLWGARSPALRSDTAAVKAYFVGAFKALPKATGELLIPVYGDTALDRGYYTSAYTKDSGSQIEAGTRQLHLPEGRQRLEDRGSSFVRDAGAAAVSASRRPMRAVRVRRVGGGRRPAACAINDGMHKRLGVLACLALLGFSLGGCGKCGDWSWWPAPHSCHSDTPR